MGVDHASSFEGHRVHRVVRLILGLADASAAKTLPVDKANFCLAVGGPHHDVLVLGVDGSCILIDIPVEHAQGAASLFALSFLLVQFVRILAAAEGEKFISVDTVDWFFRFGLGHRR